LCHCDQDKKALLKIFDKILVNEQKPQIVVSTFLKDQHKVKKALVTTTLMDLIKVENVPVFNFLVDYCHIESIVVVDSQDEAKGMIMMKDNVPRNIKRVITITWHGNLLRLTIREIIEAEEFILVKALL